jgi:hypothetical protein
MQRIEILLTVKQIACISDKYEKLLFLLNILTN